MSHMIEHNQLAYVGATPWHGLGVTVPAGATGSEMLAAAGLTWRVQRRQLAMRGGTDATRNSLITDALTDFRAIVRADNDHVFQVASSQYQVVQNQEIVDFFREYCNAGHAQMETVGALRGGAVVWALAKLNGGSSATLPGNDELRGYMLLATSHDKSLKTIGQPTQVRVVCHNTLTAAIGSKGQGKGNHVFGLSHRSKFDDAAKQEAKRVMGMASEQIAATNELAGDLARVKVDERGRLQFVAELIQADGRILDVVADQTAVTKSGASLLDSILDNHMRPSGKTLDEQLGRVGKAVLDAIVSSPGADMQSAKDTLWGCVNGATYYADHEARARSQENRVFSSWFGQGDNLKTRAVEVASRMAGLQQA